MIEILNGDCRSVLEILPSESVNCCVTSPPYFGLRDYDVDGQIGLEQTPDAFVAEMVDVFREVRRVLRSDGTLWLNLGDSYAGSWGSQGRQGNTGQMAGRSVADARQRSKIQAARIEQGAYPAKMTRTGAIPDGSGLKPKDLIGIPWRVAFALQADGWWLRSSIIWHKPNPMPESIRDRPTSAHENIFLLTKSASYFYDHEAVKEPAIKAGKIPGGNRKVDGSRNDRARDMTIPVVETRNMRNVWTVSTKPFKGAHFATFPPDLIEPCILAGCPEGGTVLDPFFGAGTTGLVAQKHRRNCIGVELNPDYIEIAKWRLGLSAVSAIAQDEGIFG